MSCDGSSVIPRSCVLYAAGFFCARPAVAHRLQSTARPDLIRFWIQRLAPIDSRRSVWPRETAGGESLGQSYRCRHGIRAIGPIPLVAN